MRTKLAVGVGLVAVALAVTVLMCDRMGPAQPPLRVGMTQDELRQAIGTDHPMMRFGCGFDLAAREVYLPKPDQFGNRQIIRVDYVDGRLTDWEITGHPRTRPPWLDRALNAVGW
jgi:hypothetical protein